MESIIIRPATLEDLPVLLRFEQGVIVAERPMDPTLKEVHTNYYDIEKLIRASYVEILVAEVEQQIIASGYARIETSKPYLKHEQHAYLGFMYVAPEFRGRGVNRLIIEGLKKWSHTQNINELRLEVYVVNEGAIKAYEKVGFSAHMIEMRMDLRED